MNKRIFAILLIIAVLVVGGCSNKETKDLPDKTDVAPNTATPVQEEKPPEAPATQVEQPAETQAASAAETSAKNETKPSTVYNKPTGLATVADTSAKNITPVDCPKITVQSGLRINAPVKDEFGVNTFIINENNMDRLTFSDSWILMKKTQVTCKENGAVYNCEPFVIQKYVLDQYMSIKGLDYIQYYTFDIKVFDIKLDRDALSDKMVEKASFSIDTIECTKYAPKKA